jgi:mycothiol synthase
MTTTHDQTTAKAENLTLRPPTWDDLPAVIDLLNAWWADLIGTRPFAGEMMRSEWTQPGFEFSRDCCLAVAGDQLVGYGAIYSKAPYVNNYLFVRTHPAHYNRRIEEVLTAWGEARIAENLPLAPPTARVTIGCSNYTPHERGAHLLLDLGYRYVRSSYSMMIEMTSAPPEPIWPAGITVRGMIPNQEEEAVFRAMDEAFQDHWGYVEQPFAEVFARWLHYLRNNPVHDPEFFFLALDGDQIAGLALCVPRDAEYPDMCWVDDLAVRRPWRRRGLALALLHHLFGECYRRGIPKVGLGVDASSLTGATRLYEKAGMHVFRQWDNYEKELRPGEDLATREVVN